MLNNSRVEANIPAADLHRARDFYTAMLGLSPVDEIPGVQLAYETDGGTRFNLYETEYAGKAGHNGHPAARARSPWRCRLLP